MNRPTVESVVRLAILPAVLLLMTLFAPVYPAHAQAVPPPPELAYAFDPNQNLEPTGGDISPSTRLTTTTTPKCRGSMP